MRQGTVLSRLLYAVFTSDLLHLLESSGLGVVIDQMELFVGSPTFADDTALVASALQAMLQIVFEWRYSINPTSHRFCLTTIIINSYSQFKCGILGDLILGPYVGSYSWTNPSLTIQWLKISRPKDNIGRHKDLTGIDTCMTSTYGRKSKVGAPRVSDQTSSSRDCGLYF